MATKCLCNKNEVLQVRSSSNLRVQRTHEGNGIDSSFVISNGVTQRVSATSRIKASAVVNGPAKFTSSFSLKAKNSLSINNRDKITSVDSHIPLSRLSLSGVFHGPIRSDSNCKTQVEKISGFTKRIKDLNFVAQEKLFPSGDISSRYQGTSFRNHRSASTNLFGAVDEGVFTGNIFTTGKIISDDDEGYIKPYVSGINTTLRYRAKINPLNTKAEESFFVIRVKGAESSFTFNNAPEYNLKNIKLLDPSGETIIQYKDLTLNDDDHYTTYISEPITNLARLDTYDSNYPRIGNSFAVGNSGYSVTFDINMQCRDDPFDDGYNVGYEEFKCSGVGSQILETLRISAFEIQNSGSAAPLATHFLNFNTLPPSKGGRIVRHIFPAAIMASGYDTTIFPSVESRWQSTPPSVQNSGEITGGLLAGYRHATSINLKHSSIADSGKLILRFEDQPQTSTFNKKLGEFTTSFDLGYTKDDYERFDLQDTFYADIDQVNLKITARKAEGSRDFAIDVVGYSDDRLLAITSPSGGFLQNSVAGSGNLPTASSGDQFGVSRTLSDGAFSEGGDFGQSTNKFNAGGDHYLLTQTPLINSTRYRDYIIPLDINNIIPALGKTIEFNQSTYFEKLYLDLYPIPSGADIADVRLEVYYKPSHALPIAVVGHGQDKPLSRDTIILDVSPAQSGDPVFNKGGLSSFANLPHAYSDVSSLKTNYSRRWRGVVGKEYFSAFDNQFSFSFEKDEKRNPFTDGFYDFSSNSGNYAISTHSQVPRSGLFSSNLTNSIIEHLGWRFNSSGLLNESSQTYRTTAWASGSHPLAGNIADAFANTVRVSGENGFFTFDNAPTTDAFTAFIRFTPDETISGVDYNQFNSGVLFSKSDEFGLRYNNGFLQAYINTAGGEVNATDDILYSGYSYPLSVAVSYDGNVVSLFTDNEISPTAFDLLRASGVGTKVNTTNSLQLGSGINMFVSEFGTTSGIVPSGGESSSITISDLFDQHRMIFSDSSTSYQHRNNLWSYIDEKSDDVWRLGEFRSCHFNQDFDRLSLRDDVNYIEHKLNHDGLPYSSKTNLTLPTNINTANLGYHSQIENDFIRFHLSDTPTTDVKFYAADLKIHKNLPRGYNFNEEAFVVETVIDGDSTDDIVWSNGDEGAKLIVSLYSKASIPAHHTNTTNYGLISRKVHNIKLNDCFRKISTTFDYDSLFDDSEPWADFNRKSYIEDFDHRNYSTEVDDMYLQYDIAYPSNSGSFTSNLRIHSAEVKLKKALVELPFLNQQFNLYASGNIEQREDLGLFFVSPHSDISFNQPSGLTLYASGGIPAISGIESSGNLYTSGENPYESLTMFIRPHAPFDTSGGAFGSHGSSPIYGLQMFISNSGDVRNDGGFNLSIINTGVIPSDSGTLNIVSFSEDLQNRPFASTTNLFAKSSNVLNVDNLYGSGMNLTLKMSNRYLVSHRHAFNLVLRSEPGVSSTDVGLFTVNYPPPDITDQTQLQRVSFDGFTPGQDIVVAENAYSALSADDEIRGVTTICVGNCDSNGTCQTREIFAHGVDWNSSSCINGGIARAQTTYTNSDTVAFNTDTDGYSNHFYAISKYTGLIPHYPYTVTIHGFTGSSTPIDIPPKIETVGYGASDEVNYSGIKHTENDTNAIKAKYGKEIVVRGDLMAVGAPNYTLVDSSGSMEDSGAVFLYRRNAAPSGSDWSTQEDQASWRLEQVLTLPSGFQRDYSRVDVGTIGEAPNTFNGIVRKWSIGQYGRNFGYSLDIVSDPSEPNKDIVVVGAPRAKFDRTFDTLTSKTIKGLFIVISDNLDVNGEIRGDKSPYKAFDNFILNRNRYFRNIANPAFEIDPTVLVLSATKNTGRFVPNEVNEKLKPAYNYYEGSGINRLLSLDTATADSAVIESQLKEIFNATCPRTAGVDNSGLPAFVGLFVDNSASLGRVLVEPAIDNFLNYFKEYTFASGLLDSNDNPISGFVLESRAELDAEDWIESIQDTANRAISDSSIINNLNHFTNNFSPLSVPTSSGYNEIPSSGGRVYVFEQEQAKSGLFYNEDKYIWNITQEIGLDKYENNTDYVNERFGHDVAISRDRNKIAIGSPYDDVKGVRVYEKQKSYNINHYYDNVGTWINQRVEESQNDITSIYYKLYFKYQDELTQHLAARTAGKNIYETLDPSGRFDLRFFVETNFQDKEKYQMVFSYKNDYNYRGKWNFVPETLAASPRVGYSVALNDDGNLLAVGCPTDSMNQFDDSNVYHRNQRLCPADMDKGVHGDVFIPGYDSRLPEDSDLVTGAWNDGGYQGTFQSYVNAGAVQLFDSRRYYPHNKVIEYGIFGNKHMSRASDVDKSRYFNFVSGVYDSDISFERTSFTDPNIPQEAGLIFINTPEVDSLSEEVIQNIKDWLDLGDRNLVLVGNDPIWEDNGAYAISNNILNKLLGRLGSRVRLHAARNEYHSLSKSSGINIIPATQPYATYSSYVDRTQMQASGVADIRLHDPSLKTYSNGCSLDYSLVNISCQPDIKHEGDLRAEWFELCEDNVGNPVRTYRNIQAAYGVIPGLTSPQCNVGVGCYVPPFCEWNPTTTNFFKAPIPLLAAAETQPPIVQIIPAVPEKTVEVVSHFIQVPTDEFEENLVEGGEDRTKPVFYIYSSGNTSSYSGIYENFDTNFNSFAETDSEFFKPATLVKDSILQASGIKTSLDRLSDIQVAPLAAWCAEAKYDTTTALDSYVLLNATMSTEDPRVLRAGSRDKMINFYRNILENRLVLPNAPSATYKEVKVAQIGGWTNRTSFRSGYSKTDLYFEEDGEKGGIFHHNASFNGFLGLKATVDENVDPSVQDISDYDVCWIANTDQMVSSQNANILRDWLKLGNKRLVITYGCTPDGNYLEPDNTHTLAAYELCLKLNTEIKPIHLTHKQRFANWLEDRKLSNPTPIAGDTFQNPWNNIHPLYSNNLPDFTTVFGNNADTSEIAGGGQTFNSSDVTSLMRSITLAKKKLFTPIDTSLTNYVAYFGAQVNRSILQPNMIVDTATVTDQKYYVNTGWAKLDVKLPDVQNSGYLVEIEFATEDPSERQGVHYNLVTENLAYKSILPDGRVVFTEGNLGLLSRGEPIPSDKVTGSTERLDRHETQSSSSKITLGPFWALNNDASIYISANDLELRNNPFTTPRTVSIVGYAVPINKTQLFQKVAVMKDVVIPAIPASSIAIERDLIEISTSHEIYCPSQDSSCLDLFTTAFNDRKDTLYLDSPSEFNTAPREGLPIPFKAKDFPRKAELAQISGVPKTIDGPVVVAQEYYLQNNFEAGVNRSRITVISDPSIIQGKLAYTENDDKKFDNVRFVDSLYPYTSFPTDTIYNTRYKITSPERGSPYKWFSATADSGLISRFIRNPSSAVTPLPASSFRGNESDFDPAYVVRPLEFCECGEPPPCDREEKRQAYLGGLVSGVNPFPQFSTTINGKIYIDDHQLVKDTNYDYLDFEVYNEGYPGDLFGFSVRLTNDRLYVGAPFAAYSEEGSVVNWDDISSTPASQVPSGVELSSYGGAGAVYMFEKNSSGGQYIRNKNGEFIRQSGTLDWGYSRKFRPDSINVGQDLTSVSESIAPSSIDANNYTADELTSLSKFTDRFGYDLDIMSGVLVVGAPGHDFGNFVDDGQSSGLFMGKAFSSSFPTPERTVYNLGTSGVRHVLPESGVRTGTSGTKFGATVLNNGAAFIYSEDYNFATNKREWSLLEKITPEGINANRQYVTLGSFPEVPFSGSENSNFGAAVSVDRGIRSDSNYAVAVGSYSHPFASGNDVEERKENKGAAYTYDMMLVDLPPAQADSGAFINAKLFAESGHPKLHEEIFLNIVNSGLNSQYYQNTGIIYANADGNIFLEVSGQDNSIYQYINHRPFINAVYGQMLAGTTTSSGINLSIEGRPLESSGEMNLMALGASRANVYNHIGLRISGVTGLWDTSSGISPGEPSGLLLFNNAENPSTLDTSGNLYVSGNSWVVSSGDLGLYTSGLLPVEASGSLNIYASGT